MNNKILHKLLKSRNVRVDLRREIFELCKFGFQSSEEVFCFEIDVFTSVVANTDCAIWLGRNGHVKGRVLLDQRNLFLVGKHVRLICGNFFKFLGLQSRDFIKLLLFFGLRLSNLLQSEFLSFLLSKFFKSLDFFLFSFQKSNLHQSSFLFFPQSLLFLL